MRSRFTTLLLYLFPMLFVVVVVVCCCSEQPKDNCFVASFLLSYLTVTRVLCDSYLFVAKFHIDNNIYVVDAIIQMNLRMIYQKKKLVLAPIIMLGRDSEVHQYHKLQ